jgi:hypothetical protein
MLGNLVLAFSALWDIKGRNRLCSESVPPLFLDPKWAFYLSKRGPFVKRIFWGCGLSNYMRGHSPKISSLGSERSPHTRMQEKQEKLIMG